MVWIHPAVGALAVAMFLWLGGQGLAARKKRKSAPEARMRHRRWSRWVFGLMVLAGLGGTASVYLLRTDLEPTRSLHFWIAWFTVMVAAGLAWSGPQVPNDEDARRLHPLFGAIAMAGAALTAAAGMGLLPD